MVKVYMWPDGFWVDESEVADLDLFLSECGRSDDFEVLSMTVDEYQRDFLY